MHSHIKYKDQSQQLIDLRSGNKTVIKKQELSSNLEKPKKVKKTDEEIQEKSKIFV